MAAPGEALEDFAYSAWAWCISSNSTRPELDVQAHQVGVMADAYGLDSSERRALLDAIVERQERNVRFWTSAMKDPGRIVTPLAKMTEIIEWSWREAEFVTANRARFEARLKTG
jgi:hypothetical protein